MPTETQKNFKKQMEEINQELGNKNNEHYSYIDKDVINSYYNSNLKKKKISIIFKILIPILILEIIFTIFYFNFKNEKVNPTTQILTDLNTENKKVPTSQIKSNIIQREIVEYVRVVDQFNKKLNDLPKQLNNIDINQFVDTIDEIDRGINNLAVPSQVSEYHKNFIEKISAYNNFIKNYKNYSINKTNDSVTLIKDSVNRMNESSKNERLALIKCFEQNRIKYQVQEDGSVKYWYTE